MHPLLAAAVAAPLALVLLIGAGITSDDDAQAQVGINVDALPALAQDLLPDLNDALQSGCPELPLLWVLAETQAESGWNPRAFSSAGAAGLLQMLPGTWAKAGGTGGAWTASSPPDTEHLVWEPRQHLAVALPWMCGNLRAVTAHLQQTGKPTEALDALAVCHIAGCSRVYQSASGIPTAGEAGCDATCAAQVTAYLDTIHSWVRAFAAPIAVAAGAGTPPEPYLGSDTGCTIPDPTGTGGCVTGATAWLLAQVAAHIHQGPVTCWDAHAWNPSSDHPRGRACDYTIGRLGTFPAPKTPPPAGRSPSGYAPTRATSRSPTSSGRARYGPPDAIAKAGAPTAGEGSTTPPTPPEATTTTSMSLSTSDRSRRPDRHTAARMALQAGVPLKVVSEQLGHSSLAITADTYTSVLPVVAHAAADDVASLVPRALRNSSRPSAESSETNALSVGYQSAQKEA